jgi:hypothetical protein
LNLTYEKAIAIVRRDASHLEVIKRNIFGSRKRGYTYDRRERKRASLSLHMLKNILVHPIKTLILPLEIISINSLHGSRVMLVIQKRIDD